MPSVHSRATDQRSSTHSILILLVATFLAAVSALPFAGSWNDGSRLATVESLVDQHTLAIDRSIFVQVPTSQSPYAPNEATLQQGTMDKLFIDGHFYSDKSPVPALLMAGFYEVWQKCTGWTARDRPNLFCYWMTLASSGLAFVVGVWCVHRLGQPLRLPESLSLILTGSFALSTVALIYARQVNNHVLLLGVAAALFLNLAYLSEEVRDGKRIRVRLAMIGTLAGLGYTIDLGAGPVLMMGTLVLVVYRCRRARPVAVCALAALPWLALHHAVNFATGGTFKPANAVPEYFLWPGCPFTPENMTGTWKHTPAHLVEYALAMLFGKRGFIGHNLPLFLLVPAVFLLARRRLAERPELILALFWCVGAWLAYALSSNNYSGQCCSIRWFVPLLAPSYFILAVFLRDNPTYRTDFLVLSAWGAVLAGLMWIKGPWMKNMVPFFWPVQAAALTCWFFVRRQVGQPFQADSCEKSQARKPDLRRSAFPG